jgi:hypothetical protein
MSKGLAVLVVLLACSVCRGGLLTDFSASYALYQQCTESGADFDFDGDIDGMDFLNWQRGLGQSGQFIATYGDADGNGQVNQTDLNFWMGQYGAPPGASESVCFKLFLDPTGISDGSVTVVIDVPNPIGAARLSFSNHPQLINVHPDYTAKVEQLELISTPGRERLDARISFAAADPDDPPAGPVTIFGFQVMDNSPQLGLGGVETRFDFRPTDFVTFFDETTGIHTTIGGTGIQDVPLQMMQALKLEVNTQTGAIRMRNLSQAAVRINAYEIDSLSGALSPQGWVSLDDVEDDPPGAGWEELGGANAKALSEANPIAAKNIGPGQSLDLGMAYDLLKGYRDLRLFYTTPEGSRIPGEINYVVVPEPQGLVVALAAAMAAAARRRRRWATNPTR